MLRINLFIGLSLFIVGLLIISIYISDNITVPQLIVKKTIKKPATKQNFQIFPPEYDLNKKVLKADNPEVINVLKTKFLFPPSKKPYNLSHDEETNPSMGQAQKIDVILNEMRNGFYIECGALDGEVRSNTLFFERERGWSGLLIEADPKNFKSALEKCRKAYSSPTCLATSPHPISVAFQQQDNMGHIIGQLFHNHGGPTTGSVVEVQCFPLVSYLKALNVTTVDYFSLDVEGAEFDILQTIPWKEVDIRTLSVEFIHNKVDKSFIQEYMRDQGYLMHSEVTNVNWLANDFLFVKEDLYRSLQQRLLN